MNKRFKRIMEPGFRLLFFVMIILAAALAYFNMYVGLGALGLVAVMYIYYRIVNMRRRKDIMRYIESVTYQVDTATKDTMVNFPLPMVIIKPGSGEIIWCNDPFFDITGEHEHLFEMNINNVVPDFNYRWLMEGKNQAVEEAEVGGRKYLVYGNLVHAEDGAGGGLLATFYWIDVTESSALKEEYTLSRPVVSIIMLDNYEEIMKSISDSAKSSMLAAIEDRLTQWTAHTDGIFRRYDRDRYLFIFEERYLEEMVSSRFSLLDQAREIVSPEGIPLTLSIGTGKDGANLKESYQYAALAIDMALSRGGDQAIIKNRFTFEFYGGHTKELEKRTKVKSRVMATALGELISDSSLVLVMGHKMSDIDAIGSAVGVVCAARKRGKEAYIVVDMEKTLARPLIDRVRAHEEYENIFIPVQDAFLRADSGTLLVVVDVNRPEITESIELLQSCNQVAVIDHHRRAATYVENATLNFHEPYASSASELVTELLQYLINPSDIFRFEAEALLAGIALDTKNFTMHTGVRTFEAAAYLRRMGADMAEVKQLFQTDFQNCIARYDIVRAAKMHREVAAVSAMDRALDQDIAAQAADELLGVMGVQASFVLYPAKSGTIYISARSLGKLNVQVIMEKLGGGGHLATAGAQVPGGDLNEVHQRLLDTIDQYLEENKASLGL